MNVFFEKIFKSFPDRQNFKIFPQRACKHLQNTKKYVIINKLISITIKNGLMVKRLRRCPLTAESAVRFRMGLPKKETTPLVVLFLFFSTPLSGNDAATCLPSFVNLRKQILAVGSHRPHLYFPVSYIWETATSAWGYTTSLRGTTRQLVAVVRICVSKFCRSSPFYGSRENPNGHANGNGNFRMGLHTSSVRETMRQLVCRRSYLRQQILPSMSRFKICIIRF